MTLMQILIALATLIAYTSASCRSYVPTTVIPIDPFPKSVDQSVTNNGIYYLADRTNNVIHVANISTGLLVAGITGFAGAVNNTATGKLDTHISGPNGLVLLPDRNELYVGDANGTVQVVSTCSNEIVGCISVGSAFRADEFAYDPTSGIAVVTVPNDVPPYVAVVNTTSRTMLGRINFADASGLEQPRFDTEGKAFWVSVPDTTQYPSGALAKLDISSMEITKWLALSQINPAGIVFGPPKQQQIFVGASEDQIINFNESRSVILDIEGDIVRDIPGVAGVDQVAYDDNTKLYFAAAYKNQMPPNETGTASPMLAIISAATKKLLQTIVTDKVIAHAVAVDDLSNKVLVPTSLVNGIQVYDLQQTDGDCTNSTSSTIYGSIPS